MNAASRPILRSLADAPGHTTRVERNVAYSYGLLPSRLLRAKLGDGHAADPPILHLDFIDDHERGRRALLEDAHHEVGHSSDQLGLLRLRRAFARDLDVDVRHLSFARCWDRPVIRQERRSKWNTLEMICHRSSVRMSVKKSV